MNVDVPAQRPPASVAGRPNFFDDYPRFFETSKTVPFRDRLNLRYEAIFAENRDVFAGARVLDIASHDGRWSFAALKTGAAHVVGIEGRPELVANAEATFQQYGIDRERYRFIAADIFEAVADADMRFDVVLCLGFLYHTLRYNELISHIHRMEPHHIIVDTLVLKNQGPMVKLQVERVARQANAIADRLLHWRHRGLRSAVDSRPPARCWALTTSSLNACPTGRRCCARTQAPARWATTPMGPASRLARVPWSPGPHSQVMRPNPLSSRRPPHRRRCRSPSGSRGALLATTPHLH